LAFLVALALPVAAQNQPTWNPTSGGPPPQEDDFSPPPPTESPDGPVIPNEPEVPSSGNDTPDGPEVGGEIDGTMGDDKFGSVYNVHASAWHERLEGMDYGSKAKAKYDLVLLGKKYTKVVGHSTRVTKFKQGKPQTHFEVELLDNGVSFTGSYSRSITLIEITAQFFIGPVPVVLTAGAAASVAGGFNAQLQLVGEKGISGTAFGAAGVGVTIAAGIGFKWGSISVEGMLHVLKAILDLTLGFETGWSVKSAFAVATAGEVNLVLKVAFVKKKYPIWKSPVKMWFEKILLDKQF